MGDFKIEGGQQLGKLATHLKAAGDKELQKSLRKRLRTGVKPATWAAARNARAILPRGGGLNEWVAGAKLTTTISNARSGAAIRITAKRKNIKGFASLQDIDSGVIRHPVFGNRSVWVNQTVPSFWFTKPMQDAAPGVQTELKRVLDDIEQTIINRG